MAILGFTVQQYLFGSAVSVIYGFYTHTEALGSIPYFEFIFVGPMSHKVHHGVNPRYIDKNYGSILNIWDRMFRTYESERLQDPVYYGTLAPLRSFNPLKANFQVYQALWKDAKNTRQWKDKIGLWFRETGWRPDDLAVLPKTPYGQLTDGRLRNEFHKPPNDASMVYVLIHFLAATLFTAYLMVTAHLHSRGFVSVYVATLSWGLVGIALVLERKRFAFKLEAIRSVFFIPIGLFASHSAVLLDHTVYISVALFGIFNLALLLAWKSKLDLKPILLDQKRLIEPA